MPPALLETSGEDLGDAPLLTDQRGFARPDGLDCDAGAVEEAGDDVETILHEEVAVLLRVALTLERDLGQEITLNLEKTLPMPWGKSKTRGPRTPCSTRPGTPSGVSAIKPPGRCGKLPSL